LTGHAFDVRFDGVSVTTRKRGRRVRDRFGLAKDEDLRAATTNRERGVGALVNDGQGIIRKVGGVARTSPIAVREGSFLGAIGGRSFGDLVARAADVRSS
jgi:hypothetical protein